ncbi:MAG: replication initiator [Pseudonocardiaceae bacterium]
MPSCADKARRLRMAQCRQGWHLDTEPVTDRATPSAEHKALMGTRADLCAAYTECKTIGDELTCEQIAETVNELDTELRAAGVHGRLTPLDPPPTPVKRSTRRRQDAPDLPRRPIERRTVGRVFAGRYRPSTFLTLTLDSYGRVDNEGAAVDPERYDYRRAARDAIHFPALLDRFWQNTRHCVGWEVQYFGTVEPQKRGAPHFHAAIRGAIPRAELKAITAATYHQVWWPAHDQLVYTDERLPVWDTRAKAFTDPDTGTPLPSWDQACEDLTEPAHVVRFGTQVHVKGILGGTEEAGRHVGYLTKYLAKSVGQAAGLTEHTSDAHRDHAHRLHTQLRVTPCSPRCPVWLHYAIQPHGARHSMTPGRCKGKAHQPEHLGIAGRRVLVSRKWSNKTVNVPLCSTSSRIAQRWVRRQSPEGKVSNSGLAPAYSGSTLEKVRPHPGRSAPAPSSNVSRSGVTIISACPHRALNTPDGWSLVVVYGVVAPVENTQTPLNAHHPNHSPTVSNNSAAAFSSNTMTHPPVACGSISMKPSRLVRTRLVKPRDPPCTVQ